LLLQKICVGRKTAIPCPEMTVSPTKNSTKEKNNAKVSQRICPVAHALLPRICRRHAHTSRQPAAPTTMSVAPSPGDETPDPAPVDDSTAQDISVTRIAVSILESLLAII
jgi:hypothetical protein